MKPTQPDSQGHYDIGGLLPAANYRLQFRLPADLEFTTANVGTDEQIDSDVNQVGNVSPITLTPGQTLNHVSAGVVGETPSFGFAFGLGAEAESNSEDKGHDVVVDSSGNVYTLGTFRLSVDFDPGPGAYELDSIGNVDTYVAKYTSTGTLIWATQFGSTGSITGHSLEAVPGGGVLVSGCAVNLQLVPLHSPAAPFRGRPPCRASRFGETSIRCGCLLTRGLVVSRTACGNCRGVEGDADGCRRRPPRRLRVFQSEPRRCTWIEARGLRPRDARAM